MESIKAIKTDAVIYLSGPMTGLPDYNYPAFNTLAATLRGRGFVVNNPAENDPRDNWEDYMRAAIRMLCRSDVVVALPGWEHSRGAKIEMGLATDLGLGLVFAEALAL